MKLNELDLSSFIGNHGAAAVRSGIDSLKGNAAGNISTKDRMAKDTFIKNFVGRAAANIKSAVDSGLITATPTAPVTQPAQQAPAQQQQQPAQQPQQQQQPPKQQQQQPPKQQQQQPPKQQQQKPAAPAAGANAFGQMGRQLGGSGTSSTGGQTAASATGVRHTANPNNPNQPQAPAAPAANPAPSKINYKFNVPQPAAPAAAPVEPVAAPAPVEEPQGTALDLDQLKQQRAASQAAGQAGQQQAMQQMATTQQANATTAAADNAMVSRNKAEKQLPGFQQDKGFMRRAAQKGIHESYYSRLNSVFENIMEAGSGGNISSYLQKMFTQYMHGVDTSSASEQIATLCKKVESSYATDGGKAALTQLANLGFALSYSNKGKDAAQPAAPAATNTQPGFAQSFAAGTGAATPPAAPAAASPLSLPQLKAAADKLDPAGKKDLFNYVRKSVRSAPKAAPAAQPAAPVAPVAENKRFYKPFKRWGEK